MSWQASKYAREVLEDPALDLTKGARLVLMLLAERAGSRTGSAIGGTWICTAAAMRPPSVRRAMHELAAAGIVDLRSSPPRPLIARFPLAPMLSTTRDADAGYGSVDPSSASRVPAMQMTGTRHVDRAVPQTGRVGNLTAGRATSHDPSCVCDGTGWVYVTQEREDGRTGEAVTPCTGRAAS